jgi:hypothetical protein
MKPLVVDDHPLVRAGVTSEIVSFFVFEAEHRVSQGLFVKGDGDDVLASQR